MPQPRPSVVAETLRTLTPLAELDYRSFNELCKRVKLETLPPRTRLFSRDSNDDWVLYLLDGTLELQEPDGTSQLLVAGTPAAQTPVAPQRPRRVTAVSTTNISIARLSASMLDVLLTHCGITSYEVAEIGDSDDSVENGLFRRIFEDYIADQISVPSLPEVAVRIRDAVNNPNVNVQQVARLVTADPAIAARLIHVANSPLYRGAQSFDNVRDAIVRFGLETAREIITIVCLKSVFNTRFPLLRKLMTNTWRHSTYVGAICHVLAGRAAGFNPDRALLAGLVHTIGTVAIISHAEEYPELVEDASHLDLAIRDLGGEVGTMILNKWGFPQDMAIIPLDCTDWFRDPGPRPDYCDLVLIALLHSYITRKQSGTLPRIDAVPAFAKLNLGAVGPELTLQILNEAKASIDTLQQTLASV